MRENVVKIADYERRSREPDAVHRDPTDSALIIILPIVRVERFEDYDAPPRRRPF